jgi:ribosome-binding protein aMBF1 (putative translation factor)
MKHTRKTKDALAILKTELTGNKPRRLKSIEKERQKISIAMEIYRMREQARLTQKQLADKVGTRQSVISRLEDADYRGHSLEMLRRIAEALDYRLEIRFTPAHHKTAAAV